MCGRLNTNHNNPNHNLNTLTVTLDNNPIGLTLNHIPNQGGIAVLITGADVGEGGQMSANVDLIAT